MAKRIEYEREKYRGIVFKRYSFTKKDWHEIVNRCGIYTYDAASISSITIDTDDYGQSLVIGLTIDKEGSKDE